MSASMKRLDWSKCARRSGLAGCTGDPPNASDVAPIVTIVYEAARRRAATVGRLLT